MYKKILVPLDGSRRAEAILPQVEGLARCMDSEIILLRVFRTDFGDVEYYGYDMDYYESLHKECEKDTLNYLADVRKNCLDQGLRVRSIAQEGKAPDVILAVARQERVDLIAMSSHGRTGLARVFYGSVASEILHQIDRPLLLVRAEDSRETA